MFSSLTCWWCLTFEIAISSHELTLTLIQRLKEKNVLGPKLATIKKSCMYSFNQSSTPIVWSAACVDVWVCKYCGNPRPGTVWSGIWGGTTSLPQTFNYKWRWVVVVVVGGYFNENEPHHKSRFDQVHLQFRLKDSKHTDNMNRTTHRSEHTR